MKNWLLNKNSFLAVYFVFAADLYLNAQGNRNTLHGNFSETNNGEAVFTENKGQVSDQNYLPRPDVLFSGHTGGMIYHLKNNGVSYQLYRSEAEDRKKKTNYSPARAIYRLDITWVGANENPEIIKHNALKSYTNYYLPVCRDGITNVRTYNGVNYKNIYNKIDLHYYNKEGYLKYDYIVEPFGDYRQIKLKVEGAETISLESDGSIILKTPFGSVKEGAPLVYQNNRVLNSKWVINNNTLSFEIFDYNPAYQLIIDPATRVWGTFYGGPVDNRGNSCSTNTNGDVYLVGTTDAGSGTAIATSGAHQTTFGGGINKTDAFLVKFNSAGVRQWGTYYGGNENELGNSSAIDGNGDIYMCGVSTSSIGIATPGSHQISNNGGVFDVFLAKFNASGIRQWCTYYGGSQVDESQGKGGCAVDGAGNVYIAGQTKSPNGISTPGSHQATISVGTLYEAFLVKFNSIGVRQWGTYYGTSFADDRQRSCAIDITTGDVYLAGETGSPVNVATLGSHQTVFGGGTNDAFLVKFNTSGVRLWGTYYGGAANDVGNTCAVDASGNVYLAGETGSSSGISTTGSHQTANAGGTNDGFVVKFNSSGVRQWGTYYGGAGNDRALGSTVDAAGNFIMVGSTGSTSGIATTGSHQQTFGGGNTDAYMAKFNSNGVQQWAHYYGGTGDETSPSCSSDPIGMIYMAGRSSSTNSGTIIATPGSHQSGLGGTADAFLAKFADCVLPVPPVNLTSAGNTTLCSTYSATLTVGASDPISWYGSATPTLSIGTGSVLVTSTLSQGIYTFYASTSNTCSSSLKIPVNVTVTALPSPTVISSNPIICVGKSATLSAIGASSFSWSTGSSNGSITVSPTITTSYTVTGMEVSMCSGKTVFTQSVSNCAGIVEDETSQALFVVPNPNTGKFRIAVNHASEVLNVQLFNSLALLVHSFELSGSEQEVNISTLPIGLYYAVIRDKAKILKTVKVVKE